MHAGGLGADVQLGADLGVGAAGRHQPQYRQLTPGQPVGGGHLGRRLDSGGRDVGSLLGSGHFPQLAHPRRFAGCLAATARWGRRVPIVRS